MYKNHYFFQNKTFNLLSKSYEVNLPSSLTVILLYALVHLYTLTCVGFEYGRYFLLFLENYFNIINQ